MPTFSFIIPVYNVEPYLRDCLDSVLAQTCSDWEAICINDGSTDDSLSILQAYAARDKRICIINQPNGGLSAARNNGISNAKGEYIFFLDSDDWILPDALERLNKHIDGQDMLCFSGRKYMEADKRYHESDKLRPATYLSGMAYYNADALQSRDFPFVCAVLRLYRREFLYTNHLAFMEGVYHEDNMFTPIVCYYAAKVAVIPDVLYIYRVRQESIMTTFRPKRLTDLVKVANVLAAFFKEAENTNKEVVYRYITHNYQMALIPSYGLVEKYVLPVLDWRLYYTVSRTKFRHRFNFYKYRLKYLFPLFTKHKYNETRN